MVEQGNRVVRFPGTNLMEDFLFLVNYITSSSFSTADRRERGPAKQARKSCN